MARPRSAWLPLISLAAALLGPLLPAAPAHATGGAFLTLRADSITLGQDRPTVVVVPDDDVITATLTVKRQDGWSRVLSAGPIAVGQEKAFSWDQPEGRHTYTILARLKFRDGTMWDGEDTYTVTVAAPLKGSIPEASVDLHARTFTMRTSRAAAYVDVMVIGEDLSELAKARMDFDGKQGGDARVTWPETSEAILKVVARATDAWDFWAEAEINVWSVEIPHEDVNFPTNSAQILAEEAPKLDRAYAEIDKAVQKYGDLVQVRLFIAGYTDTVGDPGKNQGLSESRARAIAAWFRQKGFKFPVFYQGFGEGVLAVPTGDSVDMKENRRAVYVLAAANPASSKDIPRQNWRRLQ